MEKLVHDEYSAWVKRHGEKDSQETGSEKEDSDADDGASAKAKVRMLSLAAEIVIDGHSAQSKNMFYNILDFELPKLTQVVDELGAYLAADIEAC